MKILFICSCIEIGKDGVGDYTRLLASELSIQGHKVAIMAIHDKFIDDIKEESYLHDNKTINILRISQNITYQNKLHLCKNWVTNFSPDWISLQFVPFGFQYKGLPWNLVSFLKKIEHQAQWHIMFHELWVGLNKTELSWKSKSIQFLQKTIIGNLVRKLNPKVISTSIHIYQENIKKLGFDSLLLPLFGNIKPIESKIKKAIEQSLNVLHFGTFTEDKQLFENQILWIQKLGKSKNTVIKFFICGNGGKHKEQCLALIKRHILNIEIVDRGILNEDEISTLMLDCDLGVSRANFENFGKSGSTIAMLEHGLPVLLKGEKKHINRLRDNLFIEQLLSPDDDTIPKKGYVKWSLPKVAENFVLMLG